jgi:hypothetical protein
MARRVIISSINKRESTSRREKIIWKKGGKEMKNVY